MKQVSKKELARATANKITKSMLRTPAARLQRAILTTAIQDLTAKNAVIRGTAVLFVMSAMPLVQLAGLEPEYVRRILGDVGLI
jgi:hypothetical protein